MYADLVPRHPSQASLSLLRFPSSVDQDIEAFLSIVTLSLSFNLSHTPLSRSRECIPGQVVTGTTAIKSGDKLIVWSPNQSGLIMDIFNSDFYGGFDMQAAEDYSRASDPAGPDTLGLQDVMLEGPLDIPIDPALSDPTAIDYSGIVSNLFDDNGSLFDGCNEEVQGELKNWAFDDLTPPQPVIPADTTFALPPVVPDIQPEIVVATTPAYEYPPPPGTTDEPETPVLETLTWDSLPVQPTAYPTPPPGWNTAVRPTLPPAPVPAEQSPYQSLLLAAADHNSNVAKQAMGAAHGLLPNQQSTRLETPPYSVPASRLPSRPPSCMPSRAPSRTHSRIGTPAPLSLGLGLVPSRLATPASMALMPGRAKRTGIIPARQVKGEINYADYYAKLPETPAPWGGDDPYRPKFQYTSQGMWKPNLCFDRGDLYEYMTARQTAGVPLTVWIQNCPAGSNARCPDRGTRQCRFSDCPAPSRSILKGWWRVAFDEHPEATGSELDPFHCAGFMHLFCFEKCFDLVEMMNAFDVRPDTRQFEREQKNFMALTRDHVEILADLGRWRVEQEHKWQQWQDKLAASGESGLSRPMHPQDHLWYVLTMAHVGRESAARQSVRDQRGGSSIDKHRGDLDIYMSMKHAEKKTKANAVREAKAALAEKMMRERTRTSSKRKRDVDDDGHGDEDADSDKSYDSKTTSTQDVKAPLAEKMLRGRTRRSSKRKRSDDDDEGVINVDNAEANLDENYDRKVISTHNFKAALAEKMLRERIRTSSKRKRDDDDDEGGIDDDDADTDVNPDYDERVTNIQKAKARAVRRPVKRIRISDAQYSAASPSQASPGTRRSPRVRVGSYTQFY
ncbi:hypothetical protein HYQ45_016189 [Verticillium longisporum]|uniref:Uncharacterized protein n=1 Tax=Verticillium longisporum TaxID=100787 RepID=A0A8I3AGP5_VERLO|nr:hypothetical protein HYQ45_016189 [Verticillium longisporum]